MHMSKGLAAFEGARYNWALPSPAVFSHSSKIVEDGNQSGRSLTIAHVVVQS